MFEADSASKLRDRAPRARKYSAIDPDGTLISACLNGDKEAWEALIERYQRFVFSVARRRGASQTDVDDVFQNVCIKLYEHLGELRNIDRLSAWIAAVTAREVGQLFRKESPILFSETDQTLEESSPGASVHAAEPESPEGEVLALERRNIVYLSVAELSDECKQLLTMLYGSQTPPSYTEIATLLKFPVGSIGPKRARCLAKLRSVLERTGY